MGCREKLETRACTDWTTDYDRRLPGLHVQSETVAPTGQRLTFTDEVPAMGQRENSGLILREGNADRFAVVNIHT
jgi:hypothetical protein